MHSGVYDVFLYTLSQFNVQFSVGGDKALEEISVDQSENVVEYHVTETSPQKQSQVWVISDFNRVSVAFTTKVIRLCS